MTDTNSNQVSTEDAKTQLDTETLFHSGDKPGAGIYRCTGCDETSVKLETDDVALPPCKECTDKHQEASYRRIG